MAANLPKELAKFIRNCRYLRRILIKTRSTVEEIKTSGKFYEEQLESADFTQDELNIIRNITESSPCNGIRIIVLGQHSSAKAALVNELFCQPVLPVANGSHHLHSNWRTLHFMFGNCNEISISLPESYELVTHFQGSERMWSTIPETELEINEELNFEEGVLEVRLRHQLLKEGVQIIVSPSDITENVEYFMKTYARCIIPIILYAIGEDTLTQKDLDELKELKAAIPDLPVLFIQAQLLSSYELTESEQHARYDPPLSHRCSRRRNSFQSIAEVQNDWNKSLVIFQQLCDIGFLSALPSRNPSKNPYNKNSLKLESEYIETSDNVGKIILYIRNILQYHLIAAANILNEGQTRCLQMFILSAFDMTRDMMITPKRLEYALEKENELFSSLMNIANFKQDEIKNLIIKSIVNMKDELLDKAAKYSFQGINIPPNGELSSARELKICTGEIEDLILGSLSKAVAQQLIESVECLRDSFVGTLTRCLESLEKACQDDGDFPHASNALAQILNSAYQIEMTSKRHSSFMRTLWEKMKQLIQTMPWASPPRINSEWKRQIAAEMIVSLSESRLAKSICSQFRDRLKQSHELFSASLRQLEAHHSGRLEKTEEQRVKVQKMLAPKIARYALESTSLRDMLLYGMPNMGQEIGRGQYGVVYSCDSWAGHSPCALKSVIPPDDKHWNDLAMEFYYTRSIPEHDRIVTLHGSVIDFTYGGGSNIAVLLIMDRLQRDLHSAIRDGLDWMSRLQIAIDVVQGIRYLHSQGLIHRDIKLKNVLMDQKNRAKITDLGFCKPEAMMSGSIVGTPIHMAPELFTGKYDSTVDVYAFGILFWYICAGHVKLPYIYEQCMNKDQLWTAVKKGQRPERLMQFDDNCWSLMEECWSGYPSHRPLLGSVEQRLLKIRRCYQSKPYPIAENHYEPDFTFMSSSPYINLDFSPP